MNIMNACIVSLFALVLPVAVADEGPLLDNLMVTRMYTGDSTNRIFIKFNDNSMPGCFENSAGRLYSDNPFFNSVFSQLMAITVSGGIKGKVVYAADGPPGWSQCRILGLDIRP